MDFPVDPLWLMIPVRGMDVCYDVQFSRLCDIQEFPITNHLEWAVENVEKLTQDLLLFRAYIRVGVTEALESRYTGDWGQWLGVSCLGPPSQWGDPIQMLGGYRKAHRCWRLEEWAPLKLTLPLVWILNIALLSMVLAKRKNGKILKVKQISQEWIYKVRRVKSESFSSQIFYFQKI